jgi:hypothetical protein
MGVFAQFPGATPKYAINKGARDNEYRETMARLYIQMSAGERAGFIQSVPQESRELARVLCGVNPGGIGGTGFVDFLLQTVSEPFQEKVQIVETLSDNFIVYTFGQAAPQFQYSGTLLNTYQDDQRVWMMRMYRDIMRATQLARRRKLIRLRYDSVIVTGVMIAHQQSLSGDIENAAQFAFTLIPTQYTIYTPAVGGLTELKTPFTEGGKNGISSVAPPPVKQLQAAAPSRPTEPSVVRQNERIPERFVTTPLPGPTPTPAAALSARTVTITTGAPTQVSSAYYEGQPPQ